MSWKSKSLDMERMITETMDLPTDLPQIRRFGTVLGVLVVSMSAVLLGVAPTATGADARDYQWYLDDMQADEMWKVSTGKGIKVAVIDSGVRGTTPALRGQVLPGADSTRHTRGDENDDRSGHGTSMAELIAGTGRGGAVQGLAPGAKIIPVRFALKGAASKRDAMDPKRLSRAVRAAADSDAQIISMSFGGLGYSPEGKSAIEYARSEGKLLFAATGNDGNDGAVNYPAAFPEVVGVGAIDREGVVEKYSNGGFHVDLVSPAGDLPTYCDKTLSRYCTGPGGTSSATALASASAALIWSKHPDWTADQVLRVLIETAGREAKSDVPSKYIGHGAVRPRINLLEGKGSPGSANDNPLTKKNEDLKASAKPSDKPSEGNSKGKDDEATERTEPAGATEKDDGGVNWPLAGVAAAIVVVIAGGAFAIVRTRRS
ncbi:S8 family serine peptidase [Streptomyces boninensis]|uniref:S8 family serine peptidase n=1 Tax=Streptomyces boninensis TaxID=2039455 RepID=UPI003B214BB1